MLYPVFKRGLDILLSLVGIVVSAPILALMAAAIKIETQGSVFFLQDRLGKDGEVFRIIKLRTMEEDAERKGTGVYSYENDARVTRVGRFLRRTSIDELPQLFNILKGDMSFIGMRPPLTYHPCSFEEYTDYQRQMFRLRPGITGWAQVQGRNALDWPQRIEYNIWYQKHVSFSLDVKIIFMTIWIVLRRKDVVVTHNTASGFQTKQPKSTKKP